MQTQSKNINTAVHKTRLTQNGCGYPVSVVSSSSRSSLSPRLPPLSSRLSSYHQRACRQLQDRETHTHSHIHVLYKGEREREREREKRKREKLNVLSKRLTKKEYLLTVHLAVLWASFEPLTFNGLQQNLTCHQQQPRHRHTRKLWSTILNRAYPPFFQPYLPYAPFKLVFPNTWQVAHAHTQ